MEDRIPSRTFGREIVEGLIVAILEGPIVPRRVRPKPREGSHAPEDPRTWITWAHASKKLRKEQVYWVCTVRQSSQPHAAPVAGVWRNNSFYFETEPDSVKGRNLSHNPSIVVHVQNGNDTVIIEGSATRETHAVELRRLKADYVRKYEYEPDWSEGSGNIVFKVSPRIAHAWRQPHMHRNLVNFVF